jgi:hypothetical protein
MTAESGSEFHFSPRPNRAAEISWRPWSEAAFAEARDLQRPILLSISAVWCHWCHVMDETTYSDQEVIDLVNEWYLPIRVDNDVRPDINQRYNMGGWPTTAFLTSDGDILTGATYLNPEQMRDGATRVVEYWHQNRADIEAKVEEGRRAAAAAGAAGAGPLDGGIVGEILGSVEGAYDPVNGGFGTAPKFPQTDALSLLAEQSIAGGRPELMEMAGHTLERMAGGGTYDHVEGGFFRYSTTEDWSVPHFEKMLEDHAGLIAALARTGQGEILDDAGRYLDTVLRDPGTGLYGGSQDADEAYYALDAEGRRAGQAPYVDRRVYAAWNAALAVAYLEADLRLDRPALRERAAQLLKSLFGSLYDDERGMDRTEGVGGQLQDQVWALRASVWAAARGLGDVWRDRAVALAEQMKRRYGNQAGGYVDSDAGDHLGRLSEELKPLAENAEAAIGLLELDALIGDPGLDLHKRAEGALGAVASLPRSHGTLAAVFARALDRLGRPPVKVETGDAALARTALAANPYAVVVLTDRPDAVVCVGTTCFAPTREPSEVETLVRKDG